jgi:hypothetical protein
MKRLTLIIAALAALIVSCKKEPDPPVLKVTPRHHGRQIDSCTIYIKYNAVDPPANGKYDDSARCVQEGGIPVATFNGLQKGNYYIYGYGWDVQLTPPKAVKGGFAYLLQGDGVQSLDLAVSED